LAAARSRPNPRRTSIAGHALAVDDDQPTFWDRVASGEWEPGTLGALAPLLGPGVTFLDIGAWVGPLSLLAAARGARVLAVEADPAAQDQFRRNLAANPALAPRIDLLAAAVSLDPAPVPMGARRKPGDSMSSVLLAGGGITWTAPAIIPAELAELVRKSQRSHPQDLAGNRSSYPPHAEVAPRGRPRSTQDRGASFEAPLRGAPQDEDVGSVRPACQDGSERLGHDRPNLVIKIDVEGGEYALLPHLGPLLSGPDVALLVSFHPDILRETGSQDPVTSLRTSLTALQGWRASSIEPDGPHPRGTVPDGPAAQPDLDVWLFRPG
jgi:hypothetical protein